MDVQVIQISHGSQVAHKSSEGRGGAAKGKKSHWMHSIPSSLVLNLFRRYIQIRKRRVVSMGMCINSAELRLGVYLLIG